MKSSDLIMKNDLLIIAYNMSEDGWSGANKSTFQRILYFSAALSPIFIPNNIWSYNFSNTLFGPYNNEISVQMNDLHVKGFFELESRKIYATRVEDRYSISDRGKAVCRNNLFLIDTLRSKVAWFNILVKALSIYGEDFYLN